LIHRDLKPQNILVESWEEGKVKVCDFGLSKIVKNADMTANESHVAGTPAYAAPELSAASHTNKVDIWSFGMM
jgi:serine/threonine protein kinase